MASDEGDIIMHSKLKKMTSKKQPTSPTADILKNQDRKVSTKVMVNTALVELKSRKGTSLYAIKKFVSERYQVDTEKISYIMKKYLKTAVEAGTIIQTKGIGASGSFKLATMKTKIEKKKELKKTVKKMSKPSDEEIKPAKEKKTGKSKEKSKEKTKEKNKDKGKEKKVKQKIDKNSHEKVEIRKVEKEEKALKKDKQEKSKPKSGKEKISKLSRSKMALATTPAKKMAAILKRKSMGSIVKPPKMKPRALKQK
ncbi:histone H1.1, embryonic-like [Colias croceus]|uniref:histone H1.1, embryonic-like n=1 Tax=Colias crocea TaxID=72248 RepID=UPI001E280712|nr:histone H1.1, embryonic-like [Colias croceus]